MHGPIDVSTDVRWSREGDAWIGVPVSDDCKAGSRQGCEVELLLRATDWHVEMSHVARGTYEREYIQAANAEEAKTKAANLLLAFRARVEGAAAV